jgi:SAM-dependent methyltransferase
MDRSAYASLSAQEGGHWWFVARRVILDTVIRTRIAPRIGARILEAGCGTGGNLAMLAVHGTVDALEYDSESLGVAASRGVGTVAAGALPDQIGFGDNRYDLIVLLDVLEHVEQDRDSLAALRKRLADGGSLLLTVPAAPWLWSDHDVLHHHKRRYTLDSLSAVARAAGLDVKEVGYFNSLLFPVAVLARFAQRLTGHKVVTDSRPPRPINALFRKIFGLERHLIGRVRLPIGLSAYAILSA